MGYKTISIPPEPETSEAIKTLANSLLGLTISEVDQLTSYIANKYLFKFTLKSMLSYEKTNHLREMARRDAGIKIKVDTKDDDDRPEMDDEDNDE